MRRPSVAAATPQPPRRSKLLAQLGSCYCSCGPPDSPGAPEDCDARRESHPASPDVGKGVAESTDGQRELDEGSRLQPATLATDVAKWRVRSQGYRWRTVDSPWSPHSLPDCAGQ